MVRGCLSGYTAASLPGRRNTNRSLRPGGRTMDHAPIDHIARIIATRRASLGLLSSLGLAFLGLSAEDSAAKKRNKKRKNKKRRKRKDAFGTARTVKWHQDTSVMHDGHFWNGGRDQQKCTRHFLD